VRAQMALAKAGLARWMTKQVDCIGTAHYSASVISASDAH